jgi:hypothetical protein
MGFVVDAVKGIGKGIGSVAKTVAPVAGLIPGVGTLAGAALGAGGNLLSGGSFEDILKGGLGGATGGLSGGLGGLSGILGGGGGQPQQQGQGLGSLQDILLGGGAGILGSILGGGGSIGDILKGGGIGAAGGLLGGDKLGGAESAALSGLAALMLQEQAKQREALEADLNARRGLLTDQLGAAQENFASLAPVREAGMGALTGFLGGNTQGIFNTPQQAGDISGKFPAPTGIPQQPFPQQPGAPLGGPGGAPTANPQQQPLQIPQQQPSGGLSGIFAGAGPNEAVQRVLGQLQQPTTPQSLAAASQSGIGRLFS